MKKIFYIGVYLCIVLTCQTQADEVESLQKLLDELTGNIDGTIQVAKTQLDAMKKARSEQWKERTTWYNKITEARNNEFKKNTAHKNKYETLMSKPKIKIGMVDLATNVTETKMKEFQVIFQQFKDFYTGKHNAFLEKQTNIENKWEEIKGIDDWIKETEIKINKATGGDEDVKRLKDELYLIGRQVQLQQFNEEEKVRSDYNSGIKQIRSRNAGEKNYFSNTHRGNSFGAIHNHANNIRTVGMGEFIGILNGVEFRTRHNDYRLKKAVEGDKTFQKTEDVSFPDVPPEVLAAGSPEKQVEEMRQWFKAFQEQDHTVRDYRKYFKPVLVYLEGAWTTNNGDSIDEPFESDRHHIDAKNWFDLQEKIQFTSYSGTKSKLENLAHLPTTIMDFTNDGEPIFAQWNYRILCHPLTKDLPTKYLQLVKDITVQKSTGWDDARYEISRAAKFDIEGLSTKGKRINGPMFYTFLDSLMEEIPGKDNYGGKIFDAGFDSKIISAKDGMPLNGAYYHRPYKLSGKDAMGINKAQRGYSDRFYVALTTQNRISGPSFTVTGKDKIKKKISAKASYAVPVEIIYLTPLSKWNPYNILHKYDGKSIKGKGTVTNPFTNTIPRNYFRTPHTLFKGADSDADPADTITTGGVYFISNDTKKAVAVHASGIRIMFPEIEGISKLIRQRYPIMPISGEGSSAWKLLNAIEDSIDLKTVTTLSTVYFSTGISHSQKVTTHAHIVTLTKADVLKLKNNEKVEVLTDRANSHMHKITLKYEGDKLIISECDTPKSSDADDEVCWDNHSNALKTSSEE